MRNQYLIGGLIFEEHQLCHPVRRGSETKFVVCFAARPSSAASYAQADDVPVVPDPCPLA
jgi:hypothetical protein